jgi:hypothetical protein
MTAMHRAPVRLAADDVPAHASSRVEAAADDIGNSRLLVPGNCEGLELPIMA